MKRKIIFLILFLYFGVSVCKSPTEPETTKCHIPIADKKRTKDLVLLLSKRDLPEGDLTNPVVSPDGKTIYFLQGSLYEPYIVCSYGSIYAINVDGSNYRKILDGWYNALAISNDGKKLAFKINREGYYILSRDSLIGGA